jgi:hypothetical protein
LPRISYSVTNLDNEFDELSGQEKLRRSPRRDESPARKPRPTRRPDGTEEFKCGHCRAFIGPTVSGGKHRNHCPLCLWSRHVDKGRPGDRASDCRAMMQPIGMMYRANGEQMIVHRCLGCGSDRRNRVAADDNTIACLRLEPIAMPVQPVERMEEEIAS